MMPELPEVERCRQLAASVADKRLISQVHCADDSIVFAGVAPGAFQRQLQDKEVIAVHRRGKQLWFELDAPPHPLFHFGMTGAFHTPAAESLPLKSGPKEPSGEWPPRFAKIHLWFDDGGELVMTNARRLGRILLRDAPLHEPPLSQLGFDPLLDLPSPKMFSTMLRSRAAVIKSLLLDQRFAAGVGNWIADEVLYQAGIAPHRRANSLSDAEAKRLRGKLKFVIRAAVDVNADDARYPTHWLFHRRWGKRTDATTVRGEAIEHMTIGGRTTAWVPSVQI
jgi:formamidopyrimidine-DNA glycosylase